MSDKYHNAVEIVVATAGSPSDEVLVMARRIA